MKKIRIGKAESPSNHRHPKVGITTRANSTSRHAPKAQKHYKDKEKHVFNYSTFQGKICVNIHPEE